MDAPNSTLSMQEEFTMQSFSSVHPIPWTIFLVTYAIVILTTIGGNTVVIASYVQNEFVRTTVANVYILNLSVSDILVGSIVMVFDFLNLAIGSWPFGDVVCAVWLSAQYFVIYMSVVTVIVISFDRLWLISDVLRYKRLQNHTIARRAVLAVWIYTTLYTILYSVSTNDIRDPTNRRGGSDKCLIATQNEDNMLISIILENLDFIIPLVLLSTVNVTVAVRVHRKLNNRRLNKSHPKRKTYDSSKDAPDKQREVARVTRVERIAMADHCSGPVDDAELGIENGAYEKDIQFDINMSEIPVKDHDRIDINDISVICANYDTQHYSMGEGLRQQGHNQRKRYAKHATDHTNIVIARNLFLLTTVYATCWLPYHILVFLQSSKVYEAPGLVWEVLQRLIWFNSMINPFLYAKMNIRFRLGMLKVILFRRNFQQRINRLRTTF